VAVHHRLADERIALEQVLDVLRRDVHPARGDDEVLLPIRDVEKSVLVEPADVAGGEPAIGEEHLPGGLRLLEVTLGDVAAPPEDLAVGRDLDLDARLGLAHRAELEVIEPVEGERGTGLGETVALEDQDARGMKELRDLLRERRAPRYRE